MATTTKIFATAGKYGNSGNGAYTNTSSSLYIARHETGTVYRSRLTFPSLRSIAAIGDSNIVITKVTLHLYYRAEGAATVTASPSVDGAWGAVTDGSGSVYIEKLAKWNTIDITDCAEAMLNYPSTWYMHLTGSGNRIRCAGVGSDWSPYINVVWEYAANTLTTDAESVELGKEAHFSIAPEEGDASYALTYDFGDESGTIAETTASAITWTPPLHFATELPDAESGEIRITMKVYDAEGKQKRTEVLYLTVTVPETAVPSITDMGVSLINALGGYALTGKTYATIAPTIDINGTYGASVKSVKADVTDDNVTQTITWDSISETDAGVFACAAQATNILLNVGDATIAITVTDSRGREVAQTHIVKVQAYANPIITDFRVDRYEPIYDADEQISGYMPSDVGENVWVTLVASCSDIIDGDVSLNSIGWKITAKGSDGAETEYSGGGSGTEIDISEDRTIITTTISAALGVQYTVEVFDTAGYGASQYDNITPGRANFALAASKHGASFGCLPKGTELKPMLESAYPFYAYGGIDGVTNYTTEEVKTGGTWIDGKPIYRKIVSMEVNKVNTWFYSEGDNAIENFGSLVHVDYKYYLASGSILHGSTFYDSSMYLRLYSGVTAENLWRLVASYVGSFPGTARAIVYYTKLVDDVPSGGEGEETLVEIIRPAAAMTSASSQGCIASASSENSTSYTAWKAFDKSSSNAYGWASKQTDTNKWIQLKMDVALKDITVTITNRTRDSLVNGIKAGSILGSNDGSTWTTLCTISGRDGAKSNSSTTHACNNETPYSYVRIKITSSSNETYAAVGEITIKGYGKVG